MIGLAGGTVVLERVPDAHGLLPARPHGTLLAEQRWRMERRVDDASTVSDTHADATSAVPGLHGHYVRRTAYTGRLHHRLTAAGLFVSFSVEQNTDRIVSNVIFRGRFGGTVNRGGTMKHPYARDERFRRTEHDRFTYAFSLPTAYERTTAKQNVRSVYERVDATKRARRH